ncbi:unnamed protein product [Macrosiphum euphorbiae]|nr:unnamed protein product [Macrosiphum euphorbiae]
MLKEHQLSNSYLFFNFTGVSASAFEELMIIVGPDLQRSPSRPDVLCVGEIVGATLRYLATGESMVDIMFNFRIGKSTVSTFLVPPELPLALGFFSLVYLSLIYLKVHF